MSEGDDLPLSARPLSTQYQLRHERALPLYLQLTSATINEPRKASLDMEDWHTIITTIYSWLPAMTPFQKDFKRQFRISFS